MLKSSKDRYDRSRFINICLSYLSSFPQERRIIIMSTVRSSTNYVEADIRRSLGFVANPRRFNGESMRAFRYADLD